MPSRRSRSHKSPLPAIRRHYGQAYASKFERCVMKVKAKSRGRYNPWAVCHASLQGKTRHKGRSRSRRPKRRSPSRKATRRSRRGKSRR